jgi:putative resolvase
MRLGEAAKQLNVSTGSVRNYCDNGELKSSRTPHGQRVISQEDLNEYAAKHHITLQHTPPQANNTAFYIRSSSGDQTLLDTQYKELEQAYGTPTHTYQDKASGLNENRPGLKRLIKDTEAGKIQYIYITYQDRLTRFGYTYLEHIINQAGATITILHTSPKISAEQELMNDFMSLIASFSGKFYRLRGYTQQKQLLTQAEHNIDQKMQEKEG